MDIKKLFKSFLLLLAPVGIAAIVSQLLDGRVSNEPLEKRQHKKSKGCVGNKDITSS